MSSRSTQIIGGPNREYAHVDGATNALKVAVVSGGTGGSDINIAAIGGNTVSGSTLPVSDNGGSLTVDGTVAVSSISGSVTIAEPVSVDDNGGSLTVDGTVTATQATHNNFNANANIQVADTDVGAGNPVPISDAGGSLTVDGTVTATQGTHSLLNATTRLQDGSGTGLLHVILDEQTAPTGAVLGTAPIFMCKAVDAISISSDSWTRGFVAPDGGLIIHHAGLKTGEQMLGKAEDTAHSTGAAGVLTLGVRNDAGTTFASTNGDYTPFAMTGSGALWVKEAGMTTITLSGSTRGRPIQITGTATGSANTIHTATTTTGELDKVYCYLSNTGVTAVTVTIEFGTTGVGNEVDLIIPANETVLAVEGAVIGGAATDVIKAYASTGSVINAFGRVERLS